MNGRERYERNRRLCNQIRGSVGCQICGESNPTVLDFHHKRKDMKSFAVSQWRGSIKRLLEEIDKCVVICSNDHRRLHAGEIELGVTDDETP